MRIIHVSLMLFISSFCLGQEAEKPDFTSRLNKGNVLISTTFSVDHSEGKNQSLIIQPLDKDYQLEWDVTLRCGYFIKDNFAVGGLIKYSDNLITLEYTEDDNPVKRDILSREYSIAPFIRNYIVLGSGRFSLFNETNLQFTYGSSVRQTENIEDINRTVGETYKLKLGIQPGIMVFITKAVSFEVGTSLLGLSSSYTNTITNGDEDNKGYRNSNNVDFKIDLFSLFLGVTFYIPTK